MSDIQTIPILASLNLQESESFYRNSMGLETVGMFDDYLLMRKGALEVHFWLTDDPKMPENTSCYVRGGGVPALYKEFSARDFEPGKLSEFSVRAWNMKEFYVHDCHGNLIRFGCAPEEIRE